MVLLAFKQVIKVLFFQCINMSRYFQTRQNLFVQQD